MKKEQEQTVQPDELEEELRAIFFASCPFATPEDFSRLLPRLRDDVMLARFNQLCQRTIIVRLPKKTAFITMRQRDDEGASSGAKA